LTSVDLSGLKEVSTAADMFCNCNSLRYVDMSAMTKLTSCYEMFCYCSALGYIKTSNMPLLTEASTMFNEAVSLSSIDLTNFAAVTSADYMFNNCNSLTSVNISLMTKVTDAHAMFGSCSSLKTVTATNFALEAASVDCSGMFTNNYLLTDINLPNAKVTAFGASAGSVSYATVLNMVSVSPQSTFSSTSIPQFDLKNRTITADQINAILTALPTVTSATNNFLNVTGAATCNKSIGTSKGWTVSGP
jgi:hypothetical protein